jgi:hypothetical protein
MNPEESPHHIGKELFFICFSFCMLHPLSDVSIEVMHLDRYESMDNRDKASNLNRMSTILSSIFEYIPTEELMDMDECGDIPFYMMSISQYIRFGLDHSIENHPLDLSNRENTKPSLTI